MPVWTRICLASFVLLGSSMLFAHFSLVDVHAATTDAERGTRCGKAVEVALTGETYVGGEPRSDLDAFNASCTAKARHTMIPAIPIGLVSLISGGYLASHAIRSERAVSSRWDERMRA